MQAVDVVHVNPLDQVKLTLPIRGISCVIVRLAPLNVAVSCGSGTREDHVAVDHVLHAEQSVVTGVVNVIPEFPPQSPELPEMAEIFQDPAPAPVISRRSTLVSDTFAAVIVTAVQIVLDVIRYLFIELFQLIVNVQVHSIPVHIHIVKEFVFETVPVIIKL